MRLLLINTPIERADILGKFDNIYDDLKMIPIGLAYLASVAKENGIDVKILDQYAECLSLEEIEQYVKGFSPDLIGYGATTPNYIAAIDLLTKVRALFPNIKTVMGGQHPSLFPEQVLENGGVDFVIRDEGEYALVSLCFAIGSKKSDFSNINGLSYKNKFGTIVHNQSSASIDLDELPWPAYDLLPMNLYSSPSYTRFALPVYQMSASRGCPNQCTYCINAELNIAARYRKRDVDDVLDEMEMLVSDYGAKQIQFWDPIFPLGRKHASDFCEKLMARGLHKKIVWNCTTYSEFLTEDIVRIMARAGCKGLGFGIESGVTSLLRSVKKKTNLKKVVKMCRAARKNGIVVAGSFILGFPGETKEMSQQTIDFARQLDIHYAQFSVLVPYPGTPLYRQLLECGEIESPDDENLSRFNQSIGLTDLMPVYVPKGRGADELKVLQREAYLKFYLRPKIFWMHLQHLKLSSLPGMFRSFWAIIRVFFQSLEKKNEQ